MTFKSVWDRKSETTVRHWRITVAVFKTNPDGPHIELYHVELTIGDWRQTGTSSAGTAACELRDSEVTVVDYREYLGGQITCPDCEEIFNTHQRRHDVCAHDLNSTDIRICVDCNKLRCVGCKRDLPDRIYKHVMEWTCSDCNG